MFDKEEIELLYNNFVYGLVEKKESLLAQTLSNDFSITHITGIRQSKEEFINSVMEDVFIYHFIKRISIDIEVMDDFSKCIVNSFTNADAYGKNQLFRLSLAFDCKKIDGKWQFSKLTTSQFT